MTQTLLDPLTLPCGVVLKNRLAKAAMSDSLGDGTGHPSDTQIALYQRWAEGGAALAIIGEVQPSPNFAEKPGNLVLNSASDLARFQSLAAAGAQNGSLLWLQLGHAGAMAYAPTSHPAGPSALSVPGVACEEMSVSEIEALPGRFAETAHLAQQAGFGGVELHAAHGFLLSQFLSPLFNKRTDAYGGDIHNRMRVLLACLDAIRAAVGPAFPVGVKLNATDQLVGGLTEIDALAVVEALSRTSVDLIDISGGTYFPGAKSASDSAGTGAYFSTFAKQARARTSKPLMLTGGIKTHEEAQKLLADETVDVIGMARAFVLMPDLPHQWAKGTPSDPVFPRFAARPEGGVTAWYTLQMTALADGRNAATGGDLDLALQDYSERDALRTKVWLAHFGAPTRDRNP